MKQCTECGKQKPREEFYRHRQMGDGRLNQCKECKREYQRKRHRVKTLDPKWREKERVRSRAKWQRHGHRWNAAPSPKQRAAHVAVGNAVRDGRIIPARRCQGCGHDFSEFRREGHHPDYSRPLHVVWLCARCHRRAHAHETVTTPLTTSGAASEADSGAGGNPAESARPAPPSRTRVRRRPTPRGA